ncbi:hypothetical protein BMS3Abin10_02024 [bacterium BMS3Abin10]|nr:hypothetical protein BMS3Abin10_02024 [bacterium BMS3Abin10]
MRLIFLMIFCFCLQSCGSNDWSVPKALKSFLTLVDQIDDDNDTVGGFGAGTHNQTQWAIVDEWVELQPGQTSGDFVSRVMDAGSTVSWTDIMWTPQRPLYKELPDNGQSETAYSQGNANMTDNVLLMHMNESGGMIEDTSGNNNDGTAYGGVTYGAAGRFNTALDFDGTNGYVEVTDDDSLDIGSGLTIEVWIRPDGSGPVIYRKNDFLLTTANFTLYTNIGETGTLNDSVFSAQSIGFNNTYANTPVVLVTPVTDSNGNNYPIPAVSAVNTTGFDVSLCVDAGSSTCEATYSQETAHYFVFDVDKANQLSWIDAGTKSSVSTDGSSTSLTFGKTFSNAPSVWTTAQTYSQGGNIASVTWADDDMTTTGVTLIGCVHQGTGNVCTSGQPSETVGYVAIDTNTADIDTFQTGFSDISNSSWTPAAFSPAYATPRVMVTQNDNDGWQDPQYPWARDVTGLGMDFRYCEADGANYCDSHTNEKTYWFAVEDGDIMAPAETINYSSGTGSWVLLTAVYNGTTMSLYMDGALVDAKPVSVSFLNDENILIGRDGSGFFDGMIDEAVIYNRDLSPAEILDHYRRGAVRLRYQVRTGSVSPLSTSWTGPDGTGATFYSELSNSTPGFPFLTLTNVPDNQFFQYRAYFDTDNVSYPPELKSVEIGPAHYLERLE